MPDRPPVPRPRAPSSPVTLADLRTLRDELIEAVRQAMSDGRTFADAALHRRVETLEKRVESMTQ